MGVGAMDQGFVQASPARVYRALADPSRYADWWPGMGRGRGVRLWGRSLAARAGTLREGVGLTLDLQGSATGTLEWYLEPFEDGTIVYAILNLDLPAGRGRSRRRLLRARGSVRGGMVGLQRALEAP